MFLNKMNPLGFLLLAVAFSRTGGGAVAFSSSATTKKHLNLLTTSGVVGIGAGNLNRLQTVALFSSPVEVSQSQQESQTDISSESANGSSIFSTLVDKSSLQSAASVFAGVFFTFVLNNFTQLGPVKASSIIGLVSTILLPESLLPLKLAALCG